MKRKSPLAGLSDKGFSFDLVSRKKTDSNSGSLELTNDMAVEQPAEPTMPEPEQPQAAAPVRFPRREEAEAESAAPSRSEPVAQVAPESPTEGISIEPAPTPRRATSRVKTTFLGFERSSGKFEAAPTNESEDTASEKGPVVTFPVGWMLVVSGPGRGACFTLRPGVSQIGRGDDQAVQLDFGDNGISRQNHAAIAFDPEENKFYLGHGGKSNLVRLNGRPVLSTEEIKDKDLVRIGETTLRFVALCGEEFSWDEEE